MRAGHSVQPQHVGDPKNGQVLKALGHLLAAVQALQELLSSRNNSLEYFAGGDGDPPAVGSYGQNGAEQLPRRVVLQLQLPDVRRQPGQCPACLLRLLAGSNDVVKAVALCCRDSIHAGLGEPARDRLVVLVRRRPGMRGLLDAAVGVAHGKLDDVSEAKSDGTNEVVVDSTCGQLQAAQDQQRVIQVSRVQQHPVEAHASSYVVRYALGEDSTAWGGVYRGVDEYRQDVGRGHCTGAAPATHDAGPQQQQMVMEAGAGRRHQRRFQQRQQRLGRVRCQRLVNGLPLHTPLLRGRGRRRARHRGAPEELILTGARVAARAPSMLLS
ncbi:hypothetical protein ACIQB5_45750 [Streptomyces sp. NPDC088560]|uniref:hypothetical protein n=1 Tax=Streptomyces sp. NPDC088560 TaxID=3365868 RepID=UPI00380C9957